MFIILKIWIPPIAITIDRRSLFFKSLDRTALQILEEPFD